MHSVGYSSYSLLTNSPEILWCIVYFAEMSESEKIAYSRAIEEISEDGFVQQSFKSSRGEKTQKNQTESKNGEEFNFGTQAELSAKAGKFIPLSDDSLFSPHVSV